MKKKLLIVVGAGASIDFGLPSVNDIDKTLSICAKERWTLASDPSRTLYDHVRDTLRQYYDLCPKPALRKNVNFEEVLYQLNLLVPYLNDNKWHLHGSTALLHPLELPKVLDPYEAPTSVDNGIVQGLTKRLVDCIVAEFIEKSAEATIKKASEIGRLREFLDVLSQEFEFGILTLNYDNIFTQAWPSLFTGFDEFGVFDSIGVFNRTEWNFIYHLHGSIHFAMKGNRAHIHEISWESSPILSHHVQSLGRNVQASMEGTEYPTTTIVAGYGKPQQILRQPFRTFFAQANRLAQDADSLLFLGYGFGDLHLNALFSEVRSRRRPSVVVAWANDNDDPLTHRNDAWSENLLQTLPVRSHMGTVGGTAAYIGDLKAAGEFEVSHDDESPLAVWYGGMLAACQDVSKIINHLK